MVEVPEPQSQGELVYELAGSGVVGKLSGEGLIIDGDPDVCHGGSSMVGVADGVAVDGGVIGSVLRAPGWDHAPAACSESIGRSHRPVDVDGRS
jgi:hypothetical protein